MASIINGWETKNLQDVTTCYPALVLLWWSDVIHSLNSYVKTTPLLHHHGQFALIQHILQICTWYETGLLHNLQQQCSQQILHYQLLFPQTLNQFLRSGQVEKAGALAKRIGRCIVKQNENRLKRDDGIIDAKDMWAAVRHVTGRKDEAVEIDGINAETLNRYYASISTDPHYESLSAKQSVSPASTTYVTEWQVF